jgi:hypothetical protein
VYPYFELGMIFVTRGVNEFMTELGMRDAVIDVIRRHSTCDWGDICDEDRDANYQALKEGGRLFSAYRMTGQKIWVITEADRSATTILFPDEY